MGGARELEAMNAAIGRVAILCRVSKASQAYRDNESNPTISQEFVEALDVAEREGVL
jgi:hypothetical protein